MADPRCQNQLLFCNLKARIVILKQDQYAVFIKQNTRAIYPSTGCQGKTLTVAAKKEKPVTSSTLYASILVSLRLYFENAYNSNKVDTALTSGSSASMRPMELFSGEH